MDTITTTDKEIGRLRAHSRNIKLAKQAHDKKYDSDFAKTQAKIAKLRYQHNPYVKKQEKTHSNLQNVYHTYGVDAVHGFGKTLGKTTINYAIHEAEIRLPFIDHAMKNQFVQDLLHTATKDIKVNHSASPTKEHQYAYLLTERANNDHRAHQSNSKNRSADLQEYKAKVVRSNLDDYIDQQSKHGVHKEAFAPGISLAGDEIAGISHTTLFHPRIGKLHRHKVRKLIRYWDRNNVVDSLYSSIQNYNSTVASKIREQHFQSQISKITKTMTDERHFAKHRQEVADNVYSHDAKKLTQTSAILASDTIQLIGNERIKLRELTTRDPSQPDYDQNKSSKEIKAESVADIHHYLAQYHVKGTYPVKMRAQLLEPVEEKLRNDPIDKSYEHNFEHNLDKINKPSEASDFKHASLKLNRKPLHNNEKFVMELKRQQTALGHNYYD